jgi:hypothetical protein
MSAVTPLEALKSYLIASGKMQSSHQKEGFFISPEEDEISEEEREKLAESWLTIFRITVRHLALEGRRQCAKFVIKHSLLDKDFIEENISEPGDCFVDIYYKYY